MLPYHIKPNNETQEFFHYHIWKYEFLRMPFGLVKGPAYFAFLMEKVLEIFSDFCFLYMDDVMVHDSNKKDHLHLLRMILVSYKRHVLN